ncbi:hypothetical protein IU438_24675 [Nocardia cyriacigeorgica]|jgi:hypothetical protein|uniref:DUF7144 family membrane protein n=1 Tax=Nocardia cyriacigeorgica TaxID=135487 RepID=UPI000CEA2B2E|nr:hypothetical protein [Nocardia cyriacigeorgica]AVH23940.1 hypothetical protein C5B73_23450 [Nocardia cyriacigeorgica]MBF6089874.1 hypothetical protein [Nocardia cyriacigeorgica]MBF6095119.1 hypothetical protein [Nocardia cyriacigeorgica]MBF6398976.1 hypothetical protein [Nocardia cyriacigeorgica]MBF6404607.1 hypothetical protein [Nocardia cyriacigeorgica]
MSHSTETDSPVKQGFAAGTSIGASILLLTVGVLSILQGISAVAEDQLFVVGIEYVYEFDTTTWGWIHIVLGIVLVASAIGLMMGTTWGRIAAVTIAALSIVANFLWLPYYPLWSILIIALDIVVIWAVTTWNPERM